MKYRGRPDRHLRTGSSHTGGIPIISLDFAYTKAGEVDRAPTVRDPGHDPDDDGVAIDLYDQEEQPEAREPRIREPNRKLGSRSPPIERTIEPHGQRDHELCPEFRPC